MCRSKRQRKIITCAAGSAVMESVYHRGGSSGHVATGKDADLAVVLAEATHLIEMTTFTTKILHCEFGTHR